MQRILLTLFTAGLLLLNTGCVKNADVFTEYHKIDAFTDYSLTTIQSTSFSTANDFTIVEEDYKIEIPRNIFTNAEGQPISGMVTASYILLKNVGDFIKFNFNTAGNMSLLDATGIMYIKFEQDGEELAVANSSGGNVAFYLPAINKTAAIDQYLLTDSGWVKDGDATTMIEKTTYSTDQVPQQEGYKVTPVDFGWICIGSELGASDGKYTICAELPENHNNINTVAYATLERNTTVIALHYNTEKFLFCGELEGVPSGQNVKVTGISDQGNEGFYNFGTKSAILDSDETIIIDPTMLTRSQIDAELGKL